MQPVYYLLNSLLLTVRGCLSYLLVAGTMLRRQLVRLNARLINANRG